MNILAILGASGHGRVVADAARLSEQWAEIIFYDDAFPHLQVSGGIPVVGNSSALLQRHDCDVVVAIGNNTIRLNRLMELRDAGLSLAVVKHPASVVAGDVVLGAGTVVLANAVINTLAKIGMGCIINTSSVVEHDCELGDGVHIAPAASLAGEVIIEQRCWIGIGAVVKQAIRLEHDIIVGAGAVVIKSAAANQTLVGVPAYPLSGKAKG
ncbi:acetyltransferase [Rheinheimera baltica]|uniref:acetyltransferase n=1 Tax=Rheinheimera baltica TaxID=67576 RepID=UPI00273F6F2D|nr:acetyltransferase [Rheinheimera baltica]MDP5149803.1 acetyltransferase [Rheinheimera baltica]